MSEVKKRIGEILLEEGAISEENLEQAIKHKARVGGKLAEKFIELGFINEVTLLKALSKQYNVPCADLTKMKLDKAIIDRISPDLAKKHHVIPLVEKESDGRKTLFLGMWDLSNMLAISDVEFFTNSAVKPVIATISQIDAAIGLYYDDEDWVTIPPLKEKIDTIYADEIERLHDESLIERGTSEAGMASKSLMDRNVEIHAMLELLLKKGIFTKGEFEREVKHLEEKRQ
ncbi:MAG: hypothetical protein RQ824_01850 [bacterium]|nr:hypothetical protein [bacterium]